MKICIFIQKNMNEFTPLYNEIATLLESWEPKLLALPTEIITNRRNTQNRSIKQILGHLVDSVSNNHHRVVHLQYQKSPLIFPDYAHFGNNDVWIAIQNYQDENWQNLVQLWKFANIHFIHVVDQINPGKLDNVWISALNENISLRTMVSDYPKHFKLHLGEINELINNKS